MANKFIVFAVLAVAAQASLAAADVKSAQEQSRVAWRQVAEIVCKAVRDKSWSIETAKEEYRKNQAAGAVAFFSVAPHANDATLRAAAVADSTTFRDGLFKAIGDARACKNSGATISEIEKIKNGLPYAKFVDDFTKFTAYTGSTTQAVNQLKTVYGTLFAEAEKLAKATCGGEKAQAACAASDIHAAVDAITNIIYTWVQ